MRIVTVMEIAQDILDSARLTPSELKVEMAVHLYEQDRLSIGKARELTASWYDMLIPSDSQLRQSHLGFGSV